MDACVLSSSCRRCISWKNKKKNDPQKYEGWFASHVENCTINHIGSSGKMKLDIIVKMFTRSIDKHSVKYLTYIGDGDSKTFKGILDAQPYGNNYVVVKK